MTPGSYRAAAAAAAAPAAAPAAAAAAAAAVADSDRGGMPVPSMSSLARTVGLGFDPFRGGAAVEQRVVDTVPWNVAAPLSASAVTQDKALSLAPVFAAARIIAGTVSTLPLKGYRKLGDERSPMSSLPQ